jgi:hypothetical protein
VAGETQHWESRVSPGMAVHPDAPLGAGGPGRFRHPRPLDEAPPGLPHPQSREARRMDPLEIQAAHQRSKAASWVESLIGADHWAELQTAAEVVLGPYSFGLGVCAGIVKNPLSALGGLLQLEKTFILADLHDRHHKPLSWRTFLGVGLAAELGAEALLTVGVITEQDLDDAVKRRDGILRELADIFKDPLKFLAGIPAHIRDDYVAKWNGFNDLNAHADLESQFKAGMILGDVLMDVAMTIATVVSGVGAAVRVASKVPELMRVVGILREARLPAVGVTTAADAEEAAAAAAKVAREPKPVPKEPPAAKGPKPEPKKAEPAKKPPRPKAPPSKRGPPVLKGVTSEERALAAAPGNSPAQVTARKKVVSEFLREYGREWQKPPNEGYFVKMDDSEIAAQMQGHDFTQPVKVGPPPPCPKTLYQWQRPNGNKGQYFAEESSPPERLGIAAENGTRQPDGTLKLEPKVQRPYEMQSGEDVPIDEQAPYLESKAAPTTDIWSIEGEDVPTPGGDSQYVVGERELSSP